jgi:hypothetical protein
MAREASLLTDHKQARKARIAVSRVHRTRPVRTCVVDITTQLDPGAQADEPAEDWSGSPRRIEPAQCPSFAPGR